jgi:quinol monooxygenase YgiN
MRNWSYSKNNYQGVNIMGRDGVFIRFTAQAGRSRELAQHLLEASDAYQNESGTQIFTIHLSPIEPDVVFVYEVYESAEAKAAHETTSYYPAIRAKTGEFLAGMPEVMPLIPLGGKVLSK